MDHGRTYGEFVARRKSNPGVLAVHRRGTAVAPSLPVRPACKAPFCASPDADKRGQPNSGNRPPLAWGIGITLTGYDRLTVRVRKSALISGLVSFLFLVGRFFPRHSRRFVSSHRVGLSSQDPTGTGQALKAASVLK